MNYKSYGNSIRAWLISFSTLLGFIASPCWADMTTKVGISGGLELFREKEFVGTAVKETGNRYIATAFLDNGGKYDINTTLLYHLEASTYLGQIDYNGRTQSSIPSQNNLPLSSKTDYLGGQAEGILGYRFKISGSPHAIELLGGLGIDTWRRDIHDSTASNGTPTSGITESYNVYYGKIALGYSGMLHNWHSHLIIGFKEPLKIIEHVNLIRAGYDNNVTLHPGNRYSGFIKVEFEPQLKDGKTGNWIISVYYDGYRFDPSDSKPATLNGVSNQTSQPETHIDVYGLQIGYRF